MGLIWIENSESIWIQCAWRYFSLRLLSVAYFEAPPPFLTAAVESFRNYRVDIPLVDA